MLKYKGYTGAAEIDFEAGILHGKVLDLRDVITFQGTTATELEQAFKDSVDDYLEFCAERGEQPEKPFSGNFVVRISPDLHRRVAVRATLCNQSLNQWVVDTFEKCLQEEVGAKESGHMASVANYPVPKLQKGFIIISESGSPAVINKPDSAYKIIAKSENSVHQTYRNGKSVSAS